MPNSVLAQAMGRGFFFERVVKKILRAPVDEELCQKTLTETLPPMFDYLEKEIGGKEYLAGECSPSPTSRSARCWSISSMPAAR